MHPLAPLLILFTILGILGFVGYVVYTISNDIADKTSQKMQKKNIVVTKDGMKVGVKEIREESYVDTTQRYGLLPMKLLCSCQKGTNLPGERVCAKRKKIHKALQSGLQIRH